MRAYIYALFLKILKADASDDAERSGKTSREVSAAAKVNALAVFHSRGVVSV